MMPWKDMLPHLHNQVTAPLEEVERNIVGVFRRRVEVSLTTRRSSVLMKSKKKKLAPKKEHREVTLAGRSADKGIGEEGLRFEVEVSKALRSLEFFKCKAVRQ